MEVLSGYGLFLQATAVFLTIGCITVDAEECVEGFVSLSNVTNEVANGVPIDIGQFVFPNINFACETRVVKWTFAAEVPNGVILDSRDRPLMQVWREETQDNGNSMNVNVVYELVFSTGEDNNTTNVTTEATSVGGRMLIHYTLNEGMTVQAGDVFGMFIGDVPRFSPLFLDLGAGTAASYFFVSGGQSSPSLFLQPSDKQQRYVPLVAVEYETEAAVLTATTSIVMLPTTTVIAMLSTTNGIAMSILSSLSVDSTSTQTGSLIQSSSSSAFFSTMLSILPTESSSSFSVSSSIVSSTDDISSTAVTGMVMHPSSSLLSSSLIEVLDTSSSAILFLTPSSSFEASPSASFSVGAVAGIVIALLFLVAIAILLVVLAFLKFGRHRQCAKADYDTADILPNRDISPNTMDNPNYTGFVVGNGDPVPAYADPISPNFSTDYSTSFTSTALYDSVNITTNADSGIYHEPAQPKQPVHSKAASEDHYEMGFEGHYEMEQPYSEPLTTNTRQDINSVGSASPYEEPINSTSSTMTTSHYEINSQLSTLRNNTGTEHKYSVVHREICVPSQAERNEVIHTLTDEESPAAMFDDRQYAELGNIQHRHRTSKSSFFNEEANYWKPAAQPEVLYDQLAKRRYREIPRNKIQVLRYLGCGMFGNVHEGIWDSPSNPISVAVKMLGSKAGVSSKVKLLQEAAIMGQFSHPNVVRLKGVVTIGEPIMIVLELMSKGDLRNHLRIVRPRPSRPATPSLPQELLEFCQQIAQGMKYLSSKAFVHRDLAARNILLDENYVCKIGDFGMSRDLEDENFYISHGGKIPVKWTAPEALQFKVYSSASDVWSFGALMYEIWSLGHKPFEGFTNTKAIELVEGGYRLPPPPGCPRAVYELMIQCWHPNSERRPDFPSVLSSLFHDPKMVLNWTEADKGAHPHACSLGALLEAGQDLYLGLQQSYSQGTLRI